MVSGPTSLISIVLEKQKGKEIQGKMMTTELLKKARATRGERSALEQDEVYHARLEYNQAAYNVAAAIILRTQKAPKKSEAFFDGFLFREDPGCCIWKNIFDEKKKVFLELELEQAPEKMKLEDMKSNSTRYKGEKPNKMVSAASTAINGSSFMQLSLSETILESSLKEKAVETASETNVNVDEDVIMSDTTIRDNEEILFEIDVFNENSCMLSLREIVQKLHTEISPPDEENSTKMPNWMQRFRKAFIDTDTPLVIQLYMAKIIVNYPIAFENYACFWIEHLMKLVIRGEEYGEPLNYFVQDLCIIIVAWSRHTKLPKTSESRHTLFLFLSYLIKHVYHETARVVRGNIHILRGIFRNWSQDIVMPTRYIYNEFSHTGDSFVRNIVGLQLTSIALDNNINPYYDGPEIELEGLTEWQFYDTMSDSLFNKSKKGKYISVTAAELMGFTMKYMKESNNPLRIDLERLFKTKFQRASKIRGREETFIACMNAVCRHDTSLSQPLLPVVVCNLSQFAGIQRIEAINVITACWNNDPALLHILNNSGLAVMITYRDTSAQIAILKLLNRIFDILSDYDISQMLNLLKAFNPPRNDQNLQQRLKTYVFKGLIDSDKTISEDMFNYIETVYQLESDVHKALFKIIHNMYNPDTEDIYLLYCTQMILRNAKKSYQYEKPIFENPLPNARFDINYHKIHTSWQKNLSMTPLFAPSQERTMNAEDIELNIRATQRSLEFTQTQTLGKSLFSTQDEESNYIEHLDDSAEDILIRQNGARGKAPSIRDDYYQMRFTKSKKGAVNRYHATRNEELKKRLLHLKNIRKEFQEKKITMCRAYRVGELPDIQISYKDLLSPLEVISGSDYNISRLLFSSLIVGIVNESNKEDYKQQVIQYISDNLYESSLFFTPTIGSFLRIFFDLDVVNIERDTSENSSKRRRKTDSSIQISKEKEKWIDLSLLYKAIDEPSLFRSIYQSYVATYDTPKKAIDSEVLGDYAAAYNQFAQSKESLVGFVSEVELHLWQEEMLHCYEKLTQWDDIVKDVNAALPEKSYYKLWDPEYQDPYLYHFIRSFTKLRQGLHDEYGSEVPWCDENPNPLFAFIDKSFKNANKREYLLRNYACDLTLASIYQKKYDQGDQFIRKSYESLLIAWTTLHPLAHTSRLAKLADLERVEC
ncbi:hypothetical protein G6F57_007384 [Rhizopus arrhizus]|nr:hypothetical protein G6F30_008201 [Rhizopus arrhizus]KAG1422053.1 hypothetical protein G6F58_003463 [Rhizopus delemar]KAG0989037.1 hypothetical protein G6F29_001288 [Rhizopus arrhizus]KAG0998986.1 hypothetical protein G6F28_001429 [Rhizopus arrhizus]KAG1013119.1 hypothetical protein G6F27_002192 [Rhizopus arrhizus]